MLESILLTQPQNKLTFQDCDLKFPASKAPKLWIFVVEVNQVVHTVIIFRVNYTASDLTVQVLFSLGVQGAERLAGLPVPCVFSLGKERNTSSFLHSLNIILL